MITYKLASYRPVKFQPVMKLGQDTARIRVLAMGANLALAALAAGTAWVGIRTGIRDKGFVRVVGWITGIAAGFAGLAHLAGVAGAAVMPMAGES